MKGYIWLIFIYPYIAVAAQLTHYCCGHEGPFILSLIPLAAFLAFIGVKTAKYRA